MSEYPVTSKPATRGMIATLLSWSGQLAATLIGSLLFSLLIEWLGMMFLWSEPGARHSYRVMNEELGWFSQNATRSLLITDPVSQLEVFFLHAWQWLFIDSGLLSWLEQLRHRPGNGWIILIDSYLKASLYVTVTFILRVFILLLTAPLFILAALTGIIDGLVRRDIRRFGCGYESGFIYHHAKRRIMPVFWLAWVVYLALPFSVNPGLILLPSAFLFGFLITISVGSFKKYL